MLSLDPQSWAPAQEPAIASFCEQIHIVPKDPFSRSRVRMASRFLSLSPIVATPFPEMLRLTRELHAVRPFDVVISGTVIMASYALALSGVARILEEHNSGTRWMGERYHAQTKHLQRIRCWMSWRKTMCYESRLFPHFDLVTMVSEQDAATSRSLVARGCPPVAVLPNGVDCAALRTGLTKPVPDTLVFSGALTYRANFEAMQYFLGEIYPLIRAARPSVTLRITGKSEGVDLSTLPLDDSVTLTGYVEDIRHEIARSQVSVVPIRSGGGTRLKILEAMAIGTPVVSTIKGAEGIDVYNGEHLFLADDPKAFAYSTLRLLQDGTLREQVSLRARQLVEASYDWGSIGQQFLARVESIAKPKLCSVAG